MSEGKPVKRKRNKLKIAGIVVAVVAVLGLGFWTWHNTPGFCGTACHDSMNPYVETYGQDAGGEGVDKYGGAVSNADAMLVVSHKAEGLACLDCHVPTIGQQIGEVQVQISGAYELPLAEVDGDALMKNSGQGEHNGDGFCLKSGCHETSRNDLTMQTADSAFNPHDWHHDDIQCTDCHKSHRASVMYCAECHDDAQAAMPESWVIPSAS